MSEPPCALPFLIGLWVWLRFLAPSASVATDLHFLIGLWVWLWFLALSASVAIDFTSRTRVHRAVVSPRWQFSNFMF